MYIPLRVKNMKTCERCGKENEGFMKLCPECNALDDAEIQASRDKIRSNPLCDCGKEKEDGMNYCSSCLQKQRDEAGQNNKIWAKSSKPIPRPRCKKCGELLQNGVCLDTDCNW